MVRWEFVTSMMHFSLLYRKQRAVIGATDTCLLSGTGGCDRGAGPGAQGSGA